MQDRALQIAKENAESAFTFAGKISNVRTPQDIATFQTQFAQDRMQAFVTHTQQLYSVIGETFQKLQRGAIYEGCRFEFYQGHGPRALADFSMYF